MAGSRLPSGTVTFFFTDIEGSTKLLHDLGPRRYGETLDLHRQVVRESCRRYEGGEVDTQGDAFFVAFPTVPGALEAAREAQEALAIPVRMGAPHRDAAADRRGLRRDRRPQGRPDRGRRSRAADPCLVRERGAARERRPPRSGRAPAQGPVSPRAHLPAR